MIDITCYGDAHIMSMDAHDMSLSKNGSVSKGACALTSPRNQETNTREDSAFEVRKCYWTFCDFAIVLIEINFLTNLQFVLSCKLPNNLAQRCQRDKQCTRAIAGMF